MMALRCWRRERCKFFHLTYNTPPYYSRSDSNFEPVCIAAWPNLIDYVQIDSSHSLLLPRHQWIDNNYAFFSSDIQIPAIVGPVRQRIERNRRLLSTASLQPITYVYWFGWIQSTLESREIWLKTQNL